MCVGVSLPVLFWKTKEALAVEVMVGLKDLTPDDSFPTTHLVFLGSAETEGCGFTALEGEEELILICGRRGREEHQSVSE